MEFKGDFKWKRQGLCGRLSSRRKHTVFQSLHDEHGPHPDCMKGYQLEAGREIAKVGGGLFEVEEYGIAGDAGWTRAYLAQPKPTWAKLSRARPSIERNVYVLKVPEGGTSSSRRAKSELMVQPHLGKELFSNLLDMYRPVYVLHFWYRRLL